MPFEYKSLDIPDVVLITAKSFSDTRGYFLETYKRSSFRTNGIQYDFVQDNHSRSVQGVLRGLHYQINPYAQAKLIYVIRGKIFDVVVDMRIGSPTYKHWVTVSLDDKDHQMLFVPVGFAHGFLVLSQEADVVYKTSREYAPEMERGVHWKDPELAISWPIDNPILSPKDKQLPPLIDADNNFRYQEK